MPELALVKIHPSPPVSSSTSAYYPTQSSPSDRYKHSLTGLSADSDPAVNTTQRLKYCEPDCKQILDSSKHSTLPAFKAQLLNLVTDLRAERDRINTISSRMDLLEKTTMKRIDDLAAAVDRSKDDLVQWKYATVDSFEQRLQNRLISKPVARSQKRRSPRLRNIDDRVASSQTSWDTNADHLSSPPTSSTTPADGPPGRSCSSIFQDLHDLTWPQDDPLNPSSGLIDCVTPSSIGMTEASDNMCGMIHAANPNQINEDETENSHKKDQKGTAPFVDLYKPLTHRATTNQAAKDSNTLEMASKQEDWQSSIVTPTRSSTRTRTTVSKYGSAPASSNTSDDRSCKVSGRKRSATSFSSSAERLNQSRKRKRSVGVITKLSERGGLLRRSDGKVRVESAVWPKKLANTVKGRMCGGLSHLACAGIPDDAHTEEMEWWCPDCVELRRNGKPVDPVSDRCRNKCIRYNCIMRDKQKIISKPGDELLYAMERIIGIKEVQSPRPDTKTYLYLIKWLDWPVGESTWEPKEHIHHLNSALTSFDFEALDAGLDSNGKVVLLPVAQEFWDEHGESR
ncbi:hypothetical protein IAR55_000409 [Kwoniella newhampshirensis]|uniref:Chromo domain-containing protein n=1 Tax=Kwoniella newhampshirensis TaxID=1651941 RepID=A0AAW0Z6J2_9TREE